MYADSLRKAEQKKIGSNFEVFSSTMLDELDRINYRLPSMYISILRIQQVHI